MTVVLASDAELSSKVARYCWLIQLAPCLLLLLLPVVARCMYTVCSKHWSNASDHCRRLTDLLLALFSAMHTKDTHTEAD